MTHQPITSKDGVESHSGDGKSKFLQLLAKDRENGLQDLKFFRDSNGANSSEEVYQEIVEMWCADPVSETESL